MNNSSKWLKVLSPALIAALIAGSVVSTLLAALGMPVPFLAPYAVAGLTALLCAVISGSLPGLIAGSVLAVIAAGIAIPAYGEEFRALFAALSEFSGSGDLAVLYPHGTAMALLLGVPFAVLFYVLIRSRGGVFFAGLLTLITFIGANAMSSAADFRLGIPGLIALIAAYANQQQSDRRDYRFARALLPAVLAVGVAMLLVPSGRVTWEPLEKAANALRETFEDYFHFTQERIAFSLNEMGYDHATLINDTPTIRLGGPAEPDTEPVMEVETTRAMLLRGSIRRDYTGYSWTDAGEKARYLYYDFTRIGTRESVFEAEGESPAFEQAEAEVRMLREGTSTLFAPNRIVDFSMSLRNALYYNSIGELFLSRNVEAGDTYSFVAWIPADGQAMAQLVEQNAVAPDEEYAEIAETCLALPGGIEEGVYSLTNQITASLTNDYEKALAIQNWLVSNCRYTLEVEYPPQDREFVSHFLLDTREGYCSYYATAMAVMCRIAGLPTRYVEGYSVRPDADDVTVLTGEDAHAWVEVYFNGVGWISFDPTGSAREAQGGEGEQSEEPSSDSDDMGESQLPPMGSEEEPTPTPTVPPVAPDEEPSPTPTLPPESQDGQPTPTLPLPDQQPTPTPPPSGGTPPENEEPDIPPESRDRNFTWLWWILAILALLLLAVAAWLWARKRLERTDPARLSGAAGDADRAAIILYRANLTLLRQLGQVPLGSETPEAFAARLATGGLSNPDFARFSHCLADSRYSGKPFPSEELPGGLRAFRQFEKKLRKWERLRFDLYRIAKGLGDFERIP